MRKCLLHPRQTVLAVRPTVKTGCEHETTKSESGTTDISDVDNGGRIFLTLKSINKGGGFNWDSVKYYSGEVNNREIVEPGELLIANTDLTQDGAIVGYSARVPDFGSDKEIAASMDLSILRPKSDDVNLPYVEYLLQTDYIHSRMRAFSAGSTVLHLNTDLVEALSLPLPALEEQRKIATVLYTVDQAIQKTEEIIKQSEELKTAITQKLLKSATSGTSHEQCRVGPKTVEIPADWTVKKVSEISDIKNGNRIIKGHDYANGATEYPFIRIVDMEGGTVSSKNVKYLEEETAQQMQRGIIRSGDVYITVTGRVGDAGTIPDELDGARFTDNAAKLYNLNGISAEYLSLYLRSKFGQDEVHRFTVGSTQPKLSMYRVEKMEIIVPPIEKQREIVRYVSDTREVGKANRSYLRRLQRLKQGLMQDLLSGAVRTDDVDIAVLDDVLAHG